MKKILISLVMMVSFSAAAAQDAFDRELHKRYEERRQNALTEIEEAQKAFAPEKFSQEIEKETLAFKKIAEDYIITNASKMIPIHQDSLILGINIDALNIISKTSDYIRAFAGLSERIEGWEQNKIRWQDKLKEYFNALNDAKEEWVNWNFSDNHPKNPPKLREYFKTTVYFQDVEYADGDWVTSDRALTLGNYENSRDLWFSYFSSIDKIEALQDMNFNVVQVDERSQSKLFITKNEKGNSQRGLLIFRDLKSSY